ncbi:MAG: hypothetical protein Q9169_008081 [Polycauliona sp. 2 TL-2023]
MSFDPEDETSQDTWQVLKELIDGRWLAVLQHQCSFPPEIFEDVTLNLIRNPNINSSVLFRADILYDSAKQPRRNDQIVESDLFPIGEIPPNHIVAHNGFPAFTLRRTIVRRMIPRNPELDKPVVQTCQTIPLSDRLQRTAVHLLSTIHKHGHNALDGYTKRVHHDQLISQQRVQDTYTRLKATHAKRLQEQWVEQTDSSKHVFEDLSIAAFLMELWKDMYRSGISKKNTKRQEDLRPTFPGFVDIGCGNGVLVDILLREGYKGWGFDARNRKSWAVFESKTQRQLKQMILVPQSLLDTNPALSQSTVGSPTLLARFLPKARSSTNTSGTKIEWHNGVFPTGTFIISNHADELTPWTPLLAYLSLSPFLMIPCCSHNLSGLRFRAPSKFNSYSADTLAPSFFAANVTKSKSVAITVAPKPKEDDDQPSQGNLKDLSSTNRKKQPSAYAALCDWVAHISRAVGYEVEKEMLRLPSTRNTGLIGRKMIPGAEGASAFERMEAVKAIAIKEGADGAVWVERAKGLVGGKGEKH